MCVRQGVWRVWHQRRARCTVHGLWNTFFGEHGAAEENAGKDGAMHMGRMPQVHGLWCDQCCDLKGTGVKGEESTRTGALPSARETERCDRGATPCCLDFPRDW